MKNQQNSALRLLPLVILFLLTSHVLNGCSLLQSAAPTSIPPGSATGITATLPITAVTLTPENKTTSTHTPEPHSRDLPRPHYDLTAELDYNSQLLKVSEIITYFNRTTTTLPSLRLMVEPDQYPEVFQLEGMNWIRSDSEPVPVTVSAWDGHQLNLPLPAPLLPGSQIGLQIDFTLQLPAPQPSADVRPVPFGYTQQQINLVDWYPFIPPYQDGRGWLAHTPGFFGEHLVYEQSDFTVRIRFSESEPDLVIAASSQPELKNDWYTYEHSAARNFVWSVSPAYQVESLTVGNTTIASFFFPFHAEAGRAALETTAQALALYSEIFAPYPRPYLAVVEADFLDGMEYDGLYFLSNGFYNLYRGQPDNYLVAIAAHETAHQWFYALVGNDQALEPWLDEALCTYSEHLYYENYAPEALDWWWAYRIDYYEPRGRVDGSIYNSEGYRAYRDAVYLNGAVFLDELRHLLGEESFFNLFRTYISQNRGQIATAEDFFAALPDSSQADSALLLREYFQQP